MTYKQKLIKIGNSMGIILPKNLLNELNSGKKLHLKRSQDAIILEDHKTGDSISPEFLKVAESIFEENKVAFRILASK